MRTETKVFRASWAIRAAVMGGLCVWILTALYAFGLGTPGYVLGSIAFFLSFFTVCTAYVFSMAYVVDDSGITYRGATEFLHVDWDDVLRLDRSVLPLAGDYLATRGGGLMLSSFVERRQALNDLIIRRAHLDPRAITPRSS